MIFLYLTEGDDFAKRNFSYEISKLVNISWGHSIVTFSESDQNLDSGL